MTIAGSQVSSKAIRRALPDSAWIRSTIVVLCSSSSWWNFLNTFSRFLTDHCDQARCASRARAKAVSMSAGVDCGRVVITSPV